MLETWNLVFRAKWFRSAENWAGVPPCECTFENLGEKRQR